MKQINLEYCPVCGANKFSLQIEAIDFSVTNELFKIDRCLNCALLFTNPRPAAEDLGRYYKSSSYISHTNQSTGMFGKTYQVLRAWAVRRKARLLNRYIKTGNILDYGCGTGEFLAQCKRQNWNVQGVELSDEVRERAVKSHEINIIHPDELKSLPDSSFDTITMWHVLEHVYDLKNACFEIITKLKRGGVLIVAVPNPESWDASYYKEFWAAWDLPIHLYHFNKKNIEDLFCPMGMKLVDIKRMPLDAFYVSLLSEEYKTGRKNWVKASIIGLLSNFKAIRTNNSSSLTYVLKKVEA